MPWRANWLPKAPSAFNPLVNPKRAVERRNYVLDRMEINGYITAAERDEARKAAVTAHYVTPEIELDAAYVGEMVRAEMVRRYGSEQVRQAATIGGNIANGSPIGDNPPALIALGIGFLVGMMTRR